MTLTTGTHLGPYEITSPLGAGGRGEVYRARAALTVIVAASPSGRPVSISRLTPDAGSADAIGRVCLKFCPLRTILITMRWDRVRRVGAIGPLAR
jgi:hypothetical protein